MSLGDIEITPESVHDFLSKIDMAALTKNMEIALNKVDTEETVNQNNVSNSNNSRLVKSTNSYLSKENKSLNIIVKNKDMITSIKKPLAIKINTIKPNKDIMLNNHKMINKFNLNVEKESRSINYNWKYIGTVNSVSKNLRNKRAA